MSVLKKGFTRQVLIYLIALLLLITPTFSRLIRSGFFPMQDDLQAFRQLQMDKCFADLQIPCRWVPDMGYGFGYPQFNYYPPSVFYLGEIIHLVGFQFIDTVKILFIAGFILSALGSFIFLRSLFGNFPALVGSVMYSFAPFKAVEVYVRGSLSEFWALVFFPFLFWSSFRFIKTQKMRYGLWLALFIGLMLLTHNLMSMLILPLLAVWCLLLVFLERKTALLKKMLLLALLGAGLSAFFTIPLLAEKQYVHTETLLGGYFDYRQHFVPWQKLLLSNSWGYGSSNLGQTEALNLSTGPVSVLLGLIGVVLASASFRKAKKISILVLAVAVLELLILFMIHQRSSFLWQLVPVLAWLQFPWRFLALSIFLLSVLSSAAIYYLGRWPKLAILAGVAAIILVTALHGNFFQPKSWLEISDRDKFSGEPWQKQLTISIFDYLPVYAKFPPNRPAPDVPEVLEGNVKFTGYYKGSDYQTGQLVAHSPSTIRLPLFDFPGMVVTVDDQRVPIRHDECRGEDYCFGLITLSLSPGSHRIKAELTDTLARSVGNWLTLISFLILTALTMTQVRGKR